MRIIYLPLLFKYTYLERWREWPFEALATICENGNGANSIPVEAGKVKSVDCI